MRHCPRHLHFGQTTREAVRVSHSLMFMISAFTVSLALAAEYTPGATESPSLGNTPVVKLPAVTVALAAPNGGPSLQG